jgi:hypothetical protein
MNPTPSPDTVEPTEAELHLMADIAGNTIEIGLDGMPPQVYMFLLGRIRQHVAAEVARETAELREALSDISTHAHCLAKAGPINTPTLDDAWMHFTRLSVTATAALRPTAHKSSPPPPVS